MATIDRTQILLLMSQASNLDDGLTKVALIEEAVRQADVLVDVKLGFDGRIKLMEASIFGGTPEKAIVAFSWCLAQVDRDPGRFAERSVLWQYKWIIDHLPSFPQISRAQIASALTDFSSRLERSGLGMRPMHKLRFQVARNLGDTDEYHEAFFTWLKSPRGEMSDCPACDLDAEVEYLAENGREDKAILRAKPILDGISKCRTVPHRTLSKLLLPLVRLGRVAEAMPLHHKGYRLIANNRAFLFRMNEHIEFLILTENLTKAVKIFSAESRWALETAELDGRFHFSKTARFLFERLQSTGKKTIRLRLPEAFPAFEVSGLYSIPDLIAWFESDAAEIARRFDARNGNDTFARMIRAGRELEPLIAPFPLRGPAKGKVD